LIFFLFQNLFSLFFTSFFFLTKSNTQAGLYFCFISAESSAKNQQNSSTYTLEALKVPKGGESRGEKRADQVEGSDNTTGSACAFHCFPHPLNQ